VRTALFALFHAAFLGVTVLVVPASGQVPPAAGTMSEVPLPGGLRAALAVIGDRANPDRAQFLAEFIRRMYDTPLGVKADARQPVVDALLAQLTSGGGSAETIPLPLSIKFWTDVVFRNQATPDTLVSSIIRSRNAALLYNGLLSLDDESRAWIAEQPGLVSEIVSRRAASFLTVAPGLRITKAGVVQVPGGAAAEPVWQSLVGHRPAEANEFIRSLISSDEGRLAFFFGAMSQLNAPQIRYAFSLDATEAGRPVDAARHLYSVFERLWVGRALEQRVFVRPSFDPALLVAELNPSGDGAVTLPGTRGLWTAVFNEARQTAAKIARQEAPPAIAWDQPPDFPWLCEQVFKGEVPAHRRHFMMVLFASRYAAGISKETARDAVEAIRGAAAYPALIATLERVGIAELAVFAAATRRAAALTAIEDESRAYRALAQYQGAIAMITGAATRGTITADTATKLVSSLSAIPVSDRGDYEGRVVVWLGNWLDPGADATRKSRPSGPAADGSAEELYESASGPIEEDALRILSGPQAVTPRTLDWEGTRYRLDFARAAAVRVIRAHGESSRPYLSSARTVLSIADGLAGARLTPQALEQHAQAFERVSHGDTPEESELSAGGMLVAYRDTANGLQRAARDGDVNAAVKLAPALRAVADDLLARGLMEWSYAAVLGPLNGISPTAAEAAARHDFGVHPAGGLRSAAWQLPTEGTDAMQRWRLFGSLLGLDVTLARFSLVRLSMKPPSVRPTLGEIDVRVFVNTVALIEPKSLTDSARDTIASAIRKGRARLTGALESVSDIAAIADAVSLSPQRRTLLAWTVAHDPSRVSAFLSPAELFWLGGGDASMTDLDAWGVPATSRTGCLCLRVVRARSWEVFAGRWNTGMVASAFPDLNFRLAELLSDLHMPAALLAPVLTSATLDFVNSATSRDQDDRRGLVEFVQALQPDRVEQYLALLTTDGPLVPLGDAPAGKDVAPAETAVDVAGKTR
jgi:hypothetical protein